MAEEKKPEPAKQAIRYGVYDKNTGELKRGGVAAVRDVDKQALDETEEVFVILSDTDPAKTKVVNGEVVALTEAELITREQARSSPPYAPPPSLVIPTCTRISMPSAALDGQLVFVLDGAPPRLAVSSEGIWHYLRTEKV